MRPLAHPFFRPDRLVPFALLAAGSFAFIGGGRRHPVINAGALGTSGPDEFFRAFAHEMMHTARWEQMHMLILAGPVLWALGAAAASRLLPRRIAALGEVGRAALLLAAAGWALAFILDGFVGPRYAAVIDAGGPDATPSLITAFALSQLTMARLGTVSIVLIGAAIVTYSTALLATNRLVSGRGVVGVIGLLVGGWPLLAAARGEFSPGPFTSPFWMMTAASIGIWMMLFATALPDLASKPDATPPAAPPT
jgi:hypothetical protein